MAGGMSGEARQGRSRRDQALRDGRGDRLRAVRNVQALDGLVAVEVDRALAQAKDDRDLGRGLAASDPGQHLPLAVGQVTVGMRPGALVPASEPVLDDDAENLEID